MLSKATFHLSAPQADRPPRVLRAGRALSLAAAPTFAMMALLIWRMGGGSAGTLCSAGHGGASLGGMITMYMLMSAFHTGPWLKLLARVCS